MGGSPKETTTKVEPWGGAQPYLVDTYAQYDKLIKEGAPKQWSGPTVADQSAATKNSQSMVQNYATGSASNILGNAQNTVNGLTSGTSLDQTGNNALKGLLGGVQTGSDPSTAGAGQFANGAYVGAAPGTQTLTNGTGYTNAATGLQTQQANSLASSSNPTLANLNATASGAYVGKNPYLDQAVGNATQKIADQLGNVTNPTLTSQAAGVGRLGSNASASMLNNAQSAAADAMTRTATDMYANQYNTDTQRMLDANSQVGQFYNTDVANRNNANAALAATSNTQQGLRNDAANSLNSQYSTDRNQQMQGLGMQSDIYNNDVATKFNNAGLTQGAASALNGNQNAQYNTQLQGASMAGQQYQNGMLPADLLAQLGQTQDTRAQDVLNNDIQRYEAQQQQQLTNLGNFTNILNGGGYSNTTTPVYNNTASQVFGGLTSLLGLFASDERIKNVGKFMGFLPSGVAVFEWTYKDDPEQQIYVGPMAQDLEEIMPEAVVEFGGVKHIVMDRYLEAA
ncbi:tail fiber domain-containing protein [Agrobacterium rosae]|uniref:tail fiber domain-containing protein n=1 Tax=Agrobacterium rosae TaxID=1972867 RepID=UPI0019D3638E|nr:tail fiber domain-containing protein [Agrobacterium rosae]MBN7809113.1 tail fiber domain-containing protein [Agrobacterium rosae]